MLFGKLFIIKIVDQTDNAPFLLIFSPLPGKKSHYAFHSQCVFDEAITLVVFCKKAIGLLSGRDL
jgi:hypothetical protein